MSDFLDAQTPEETTQITVAMAAVTDRGMAESRHLRGEIYEVRAASDGKAYRVLFALEGKRGQILLAIEAFEKKTQRTPARSIERAEDRLTDWRARAKPRAID